MRTTALKLSQLWKLRGPRAVFARLMSQYTSSFYSIRVDNIYKYTEVTAPPKSFDGYDLVIREVPENDSLEWDEEITSDPIVDADRFKQGARRYAAIWNGRGIDICWVVSNCDYHDYIDQFTIRLRDKMVYLFDYRGIQNKRPPAFCRFKLWVEVARIIIASENAREEGVEFYALVADDNRVSNAFHIRKLGATLVGQLRTRMLFGKPTPLFDENTPKIFIES